MTRVVFAVAGLDKFSSVQNPPQRWRDVRADTHPDSRSRLLKLLASPIRCLSNLEGIRVVAEVWNVGPSPRIKNRTSFQLSKPFRLGLSRDIDLI